MTEDSGKESSVQFDVIRHRYPIQKHQEEAMGRKKVNLQWKIHDTASQERIYIYIYQKRVKNLLKKAKEISTLCGVDACNGHHHLHWR